MTGAYVSSADRHRKSTKPREGAPGEAWHAASAASAASSDAWRAALGDDGSGLLERRRSWPLAARMVEGCDWESALASVRSAIREATGSSLIVGGPELPFVDLWQPVVTQAIATLRAELALSLHDSAWQSLSGSLLNRLCEIAEPTLWQLFNRERGPTAMLLAHLDDGPPSRAAYQAFIERHRADGLTALLSEFPVLGRLLGTVTALWLQSSAEMLRRVDADRTALTAMVGNGALTHVQSAASDPHRNGRTVAILTFGEGATASRVVYKPKDLRVDETYQSLLRDLNQHSTLPPLRELQMLVRPGYGYVEFITHRPCTNVAQLEQFYRNAGRMTAMLHVLSCTDCHHENLIAHGDQLVLIDTETLLEGELPRLDGGTRSESTSGLTRAISESVLVSGLLPTWQFVGPHRIAKDVSALGISSPLQPTVRREAWSAINTDGMMITHVDAPAAAPTSLPVGVGEPNPFEAHLDVYLDGFRQQAKVLQQRREEWLAPTGLLSRFEGLPRRVVMRSTHVYFALQHQLLHPTALVSAEAQGLVLEQLARPFLASKNQPRHWSVFDAEVRQLEQLDIPFFTHAVDGAALELAAGMPPVSDFILTSGLETCRARLAGLDEESIAFQCRLATGAVHTRRPRRASRTLPLTSIASPSSSERLTRTNALAREIANLAVLDETLTPQWLGVDLGADGDTLCFGAVGSSLYGGSAGVALLDAALGRPNAGIFNAIAAPDDDAMLKRLWREPSLGLAGTGGLLLTLVELDHLGASPPNGWSSHRSLALRLLSGLTETRLHADLDFDVMSGSAGLIGPLLALNDSTATQWAIRAGHHLVAHQLDNGGWPARPALAASQPLTGFSHGASGLAAALGALHRNTNEPAFLDAARRALAYERACYQPTNESWPDFRAGGAQVGVTSWCHGAPGIALARLCLSHTALNDSDLALERDVALAVTARAQPSLDNLCCGSMGLVAILRCAGNRWADAADRLEANVLARGSFSTLNTGDGGVLLPAFMTGLSGIALVLLHRPHADASVARLISAGLLERAR